MTRLTTAAELVALPRGAVVIDMGGDAWQKRSAVAGRPFAQVGDDTYRTAGQVLVFAPLTLVWTPEQTDDNEGAPR
jgi:hypothetical protein